MERNRLSSTRTTISGFSTTARVALPVWPFEDDEPGDDDLPWSTCSISCMAPTDCVSTTSATIRHIAAPSKLIEWLILLEAVVVILIASQVGLMLVECVG